MFSLLRYIEPAMIAVDGWAGAVVHVEKNGKPSGKQKLWVLPAGALQKTVLVPQFEIKTTEKLENKQKFFGSSRYNNCC